MKNILPTKRFAKIFGLVLAGLGLLTFGIFQINANQTQVENPVLVAVNEANSIFEVDSDDDGIADWEEALWGTSPYNADTDGDGQSDFVYIQAEKTARAEASGASLEDEDNETEALAKQIFATTIAYQEKGLSSVQAFEQLNRTLGAQISQTADLPDIYSMQDVTVDANKSATQYAMDILTLMEPYQNEIGTELAIVSGVQNKAQMAQQLRGIATTYQTLENETRAVSVPSGFGEYHAALLNTYFKLKTAANNMAELDGNPVVGIIGIQQYNNASDQFTQLLEAFE